MAISMRLTRRLLLGVVAAPLAGLLLSQSGQWGPQIQGAQSRDLRLCVDREGVDVDLAQVRGRLERAMRADIERHPRFGLAGFSPGRWSIAVGCPSPPALLRSGEKAVKNGGRPFIAGPVAQPSGFRTFVFIVPQAEIDRMFGPLPYQIAVQEHVCSGDNCATVANAWYVSPETLARPASPVDPVARGLVLGIGLEPPIPDTPRSGPQTK